MRIRTVLGVMVMAFVMGCSFSAAQEGGQSLADLARKEREKRKEAAKPKTVITNEGAVNASEQGARETQSGSAAAASSASAGRAVPLNVGSKVVGVGLVAPSEMQVSSMSIRGVVILDCKGNAATCFARVESETIPEGKQPITDSDRKAWDNRRPTQIAGKFSRDSSRDLTVAGYPAYEVMLRDEKSRRLRVVYVLASEAGRLYQFIFQGASSSADEFDKWAPVFEDLLQSFKPWGKASEQAQIPSAFDGLTTPEVQALWVLIGFTMLEDTCKDNTGNYLAVEGPDLSDDLGKECQGAHGSTHPDVARIKQFQSETGYRLRVAVRGDGYDATATPKQAGLRAFLTDGKRLFVTRKGPASRQDESIVLGDALELLEGRGSH